MVDGGGKIVGAVYRLLDGDGCDGGIDGGVVGGRGLASVVLESTC